MFQLLERFWLAQRGLARHQGPSVLYGVEVLVNAVATVATSLVSILQCALDRCLVNRSSVRQETNLALPAAQGSRIET